MIETCQNHDRNLTYFDGLQKFLKVLYFNQFPAISKDSVSSWADLQYFFFFQVGHLNPLTPQKNKSILKSRWERASKNDLWLCAAALYQKKKERKRNVGELSNFFCKNICPGMVNTLGVQVINIDGHTVYCTPSFTVDLNGSRARKWREKKCRKKSFCFFASPFFLSKACESMLQFPIKNVCRNH